MKALINKYLDERQNEMSAIRGNFKIDTEKLDDLKQQGKLDPATYEDIMKTLKLKEENMVRQTELALEKNQKNEDAQLRSELEKKHLGE